MIGQLPFKRKMRSVFWQLRRTGYDMQITANDGVAATGSSVPTMPSAPHGYRVLHFLSFRSHMCLQWRGLPRCFCYHKSASRCRRHKRAEDPRHSPLLPSPFIQPGFTWFPPHPYPNIACDFQIGIALYRALIRAADHVMQAAGGRRVNTTARRDRRHACCLRSFYNRRRKAFPLK